MNYIDVTSSPSRVMIKFSAELENIELACEQIRMFLNSKNIQENFAVILPLREALLNAVVHGSGNDPGKEVFCEVCIDGFELLTTVRDQGDGFEWKKLPEVKPGLDKINGRGVSIMKHYSDNVKYNERGNEVMLVRKILTLTRVDS